MGIAELVNRVPAKPPGESPARRTSRFPDALAIFAALLLAAPVAVAQDNGEQSDDGNDSLYDFDQTIDISGSMTNEKDEGDVLITFSGERDLGAWTIIGDSQIVGADDPIRVLGEGRNLDIESIELQAQLRRDRSQLDLRFGDVAPRPRNELVANTISGRGMSARWHSDNGLGVSVGVVSPNYLTGYAGGIASRNYDGYRSFVGLDGEHELAGGLTFRWGMNVFDGRVEDTRFGDVENNRVIGSRFGLESVDGRFRYSLSLARSDYTARTSFGRSHKQGWALYQEGEVVLLDGDTRLSARFENERIAPGFRATEASWTSDLNTFRSGLYLETDKIDATLDWTISRDNLRDDATFLTTRSNELRSQFTYYLDAASPAAPTSVSLDAGTVTISPGNAGQFLRKTGLGPTSLDEYTETYGSIDGEWELDWGDVRLGYERTVHDDKIVMTDEDFEENRLRLGYSYDDEVWGVSADAHVALGTEETAQGGAHVRNTDWELSGYYDAPRQPRFSARLTQNSRRRDPFGRWARERDRQTSLQLSLELTPWLTRAGLPDKTSAEIFADTFWTRDRFGRRNIATRDTIVGISLALTL